MPMEFKTSSQISDEEWRMPESVTVKDVELRQGNKSLVRVQFFVPDLNGVFVKITDHDGNIVNLSHRQVEFVQDTLTRYN